MEENVEKTYTDPVTGKFVPGNPGGGRPTGQRNYATIYREALVRLGETDGKSPEEIEDMIEEVGLKEAMKGNFAFWRDIKDRIHGKPMQKTDITSKGEQIVFMPADVISRMNGGNETANS